MIIPSIRSDSFGNGAYLSPRGKRLHQGVDFETPIADTPFFSDVSGEVIRIGYPYAKTGPKSEYRLIEIRMDAQTKIKYMYLSPTVLQGERIERGEVIGHVQDLNKIYPGITNHVHFEVWVEGMHVDPLQWLKMRGYA